MIAGYTATPELMDAWAEHMVDPHEPVYLTEAQRTLLPPRGVLLTRSELAKLMGVGFHDAYWTYQVKPAATWVVLLPPARARSLPGELLAQQVEFGRGQCYADAFVADVLAGVTGEERAATRALLAQDRVETPQGAHTLLRWDVWQQLPRNVRHAWLARYALLMADENLLPCLGPTLTAVDWSDVERVAGPAVHVLAGTFAPRSGPNCFATALAGVTPDLAVALTTAHLWLHTEPFARALTSLGRTRTVLANLGEAAPGGVLVWENNSGVPLHAAVYLGAGRVFQKPAQHWSRPRQVVALAAVIADWADTLAAGGQLVQWV